MIKRNDPQYLFVKFDSGEDAPEVFISKHRNREDALFNFIFETLGYHIVVVEGEISGAKFL